MKKIFLTIITISLIMAGCQKFEIEQTQVQTTNTKSQLNTAPQFTVENGMLVFETEEDMQQKIQYLLTLNQTEYLNWCQKNNFKSLQLTYIDALNLQADYIEYINQEKEKGNLQTYPQYCTTLEKLIDNGIIIKEKDDFLLYIKQPHWAYILNENGCIKIENKKHKFYSDKVIIDDKKELRIDYPSNHYYCTNKEFGFSDNKRNVKLTVEAYLSKSLYSNEYQLYFYSRQNLFKNNKPNLGYFHLLSHTNNNVRYTDNYGNNQNFFNTPIGSSGVWSEKTTVYQYFYIKGEYGKSPQDCIHMPHIKAAFLSFHVLDKYFLGSSELYYDYSIIDEFYLFK